MKRRTMKKRFSRTLRRHRIIIKRLNDRHDWRIKARARLMREVILDFLFQPWPEPSNAE